ncbi:siroheme synthase CysG [uncultured Nisaea sp.]|uniref:siroheme synthase CysG n=1 Tax=uncultured Nisaea sp. TaxID=538215 RepID=UPI0030EC043D|tara:strand:- start:880 stop:2379 length:1500 start_codon:yes stop_codon:yes gene_type:complete
MRGIKKPAERRPARLEPLAVLPVFCTLDRKPVLVAGGTDAAAWKAELLAAAGAHVVVFAEDISEEMQELLDNGASAGRIVRMARDWRAPDLDGMAFAICDAVSYEEAVRFHAAARAAGVIVNVIDKPEFCQVQFGSIVNRSPVVVGISTSGAAPILGQAVRRRIETVLPRALAAWAGLAERVREEVMERCMPGAGRRAFWERFVDLAFTGAEPDRTSGNASGFISRLIGADKEARQGKVTLVGAGPGAADLMTVKAVRVLQSADVILFDDLVSDEVLELARREAKRMLVGKRGGRESCRQEDINALMVKLAGQGKHVVRLKSGDPMVFGRAGEEIAELENAGIPVTVVPGITAGAAMASAFGTSLTHRDRAQSVRFVTGHSRDGGLPETLDWKGLADPATTTLFYMGGRMGGRISARLLDAGLPGETPVAVARDISRSGERCWFGTLSALGDGIDEIGFDRPVLIGVGAVFADAAVRAAAPAESDEGARLFAGGFSRMV